MSFKTIKMWMASLLALALVACGGGGGSTAGTQVLGGGNSAGTVAVAGLVVTLSAPSIANSGAGTVTATVTALDANNNALPSVPVTLAANNNAVLTVLGGNGSVTDSSGRLTATVGIGSDTSNRNILLTASSGSASGTATLAVVNSTATGTVAASMDVVASATSVGTGGEAVQIRVFVKDANNNALTAAPVAFKANTGTLSSVAAVTDSAGVASANFAAGSDRTNRTATITVTSGVITKDLTLPISGTTLTLQGPTSLVLGTSAAFDIVATDSKSNVIPGIAIAGSSSLNNPLSSVGGTTTSATGLLRFNYTASSGGTDNLSFTGAGTSVSPLVPLSVSGLNFAFTAPVASSVVAVNTAQTVTVQLRVGGAVPAPTTISFASTGGTLSAASTLTDAATGTAQVSVQSASAGPVTVQASVTVNGVLSTTTIPLTIVATDPQSLVLQVSPASLAPNVGGAITNQAQVLAKVVDGVGNPVQGQTVNFTRVADPSGGNLQQVSAVTDGSGKASVTYVSGAQSTANNGVRISAAVAGKPSVTGQASLTVNQAALFIALGTGNTVAINAAKTTYSKDWVAYVTDANGIAVNAATLTVKAVPNSYRTGRLFFDGNKKLWVYDTTPTASYPGIYECRNEDRNGNGVLDAGEDDNNDGVLWPGNVIAVSPSNIQTANGLASIRLTYAESFAPWINVKLTTSAIVSGTESVTSADSVVGVAAEDLGDITKPPAGVVSPFGLAPKVGAVCVFLSP